MKRLINNSVYSINAAALLIGAAGLLSRILGVLRDRLLAGHFGASRELDIYYAAFQIPDLLYNLFLLGAASAAIIPVFTGLREKNEKEAYKFINVLLGLFLWGSVVVSLTAIVFAPYFVRLIAPGFSPEELSKLVVLTRIMILSPVLLGISSIVSSVLQVFRRFLVFALTGVFYNLGIIFGALFLLPHWGIEGVALGVILGALLHLMVQLPSLSGLGFRWSEFFRGAVLKPILGHPIHYRQISYRHVSDPLKAVLKLSLPRVVAMSLNQAVAIALIAIGSVLIPGSIAVFSFAYNLHFLPIGIFGVSFAVAAFPAINQCYVRREGEKFLKAFYDTVRSILFWILPVSVLFYVLRAQIVRVGLGAGKFDWEDTMLTAASLGIMTLAVLAHSLVAMLIRSFYALENTRRPLVVNVIASIITVILAVGFIKVLQDRSGFFTSFFARLLRVDKVDDITVLGIALAVSLGNLFNALFLLSSFKREFRLKFGEDRFNKVPAPWADLSKMLVVAVLAGIAGFGMLRMVNLFVSLETFWGVFWQGFLAFVFSMGFYFFILSLLGNREVKSLKEIWKKKWVGAEVLPQEVE